MNVNPSYSCNVNIDDKLWEFDPSFMGKVFPTDTANRELQATRKTQRSK